MTFYNDNDEGGDEVPELKLRVEGDDDDVNAKRQTLRQRLLEESESEENDSWLKDLGFSFLLRRSIWEWIKLGILLIIVGLLAAVFLKWVGPFFMDKELMPLVNWEMATFSAPMLAVVVFTSVALFPTILLPSSPSMWLAGMAFSYGFGFLLIISAAAVGVSIPFIIGSLFLHRIQGWLEKYPKKAAFLRAAGEGNRFHQFKAVTLIRLSPFPYMIYNYCAVATHVEYGPYILGSLIGMVPEIFVSIYTGTLIQTLADASQERSGLSAVQILLNVGGFLVTLVATIVFTVYAKRQLRKLQMEEELV
ncbi:Leucine-rich repeat protein kinase family protein isoform 1 [Hibiscus syriacus]|uniref:Leucine-rich repeat protein kinase family protein isoform 1 n=2 Tax=Hibiscus syriacus TaxID=106335 RepID=A0A6A2YHW9_HIBSY|nr:transmembrane protein 64-like isoform X1 [Hibiscus syriacus]KAE8675687.1 Leucine-rich repeat protein kinase family protein isoform 1 [Hibiscus syriacus]